MEIKINTGVQKYNLGGKVEVEFNPTDATFAEKIYTTFEELEKKQQEYSDEIKNVTDERIFDIGRRIDGEMRTAINNLFGLDVMTPLLGEMNAYAMADGLPVWANIILAIIDVMDESAIAEQKKSTARINKYTKKYHK